MTATGEEHRSRLIEDLGNLQLDAVFTAKRCDGPIRIRNSPWREARRRLPEGSLAAAVAGLLEEGTRRRGCLQSARRLRREMANLSIPTRPRAEKECYVDCEVARDDTWENAPEG